jgi:2-phospho-L-lactate/phosphoenolpyruvate guanylyltransferase
VQHRPIARVVIPVKAFGQAKNRLATALDPSERADLARSMATRVVRAAEPLPVTVVCDDEEVASWARSVGAEVGWTPGLDLSEAVSGTVRRLAREGVERVVVAHGDLPFASDLDLLAWVAPYVVILVPDRHGRGTNVVSAPTAADFGFSYGAGSLERHRAEVERLGLVLRIVHSERLGWDVDEPADLEAPGHLGHWRSESGVRGDRSA